MEKRIVFLAGLFVFELRIKERKEVRGGGISLREQGTGTETNGNSTSVFPNVSETRSWNTKEKPIAEKISHDQDRVRAEQKSPAHNLTQLQGKKDERNARQLAPLSHRVVLWHFLLSEVSNVLHDKRKGFPPAVWHACPLLTGFWAHTEWCFLCRLRQRRRHRVRAHRASLFPTEY